MIALPVAACHHDQIRMLGQRAANVRPTARAEPDHLAWRLLSLRTRPTISRTTRDGSRTPSALRGVRHRAQQHQRCVGRGHTVAEVARQPTDIQRRCKTVNVTVGHAGCGYKGFCSDCCSCSHGRCVDASTVNRAAYDGHHLPATRSTYAWSAMGPSTCLSQPHSLQTRGNQRVGHVMDLLLLTGPLRLP